jgi:hypothetical protein
MRLDHAAAEQQDAAGGAQGRWRAHPSLAFAAALVRNRVGSRPREQDRVGREIDPVRPIGGIEHQTALVGRARRRDGGHLEASQLDHGPIGGPRSGDVIGPIARRGQLQVQAEHGGAVPQPAFQLVAQEVRAPLSCIVRGEIRFARLGEPVIAAEPARAVRRGEQEGVLRVVARLRVAGRDWFLRQSLDEGGGGGVAGEKAGYRVRSGLAGDRVRQLGPEKGEQEAPT